MARAGALRVVNVNIIVTRRNTVFKMYAILEIRDRQRVYTVDHTAFAHAHHGRSGNKVRVAEGLREISCEGIAVLLCNASAAVQPEGPPPTTITS